jgi:maltose/moltooligosaccharide transporter
MGIFNIFIVLPQVVAALNGVNYAASLFGDASIFALVVAGISLIISGFCNLLITEKNAIRYHA